MSRSEAEQRLRVNDVELPAHDSRLGYLDRWRRLTGPAWLYLTHAALLTASLAISRLFFNLTITALQYPRTFIGVLDTISIGTAAILSLPLWWLVTRIGFRQALLASAALQVIGVSLIALLPIPAALMIAVALTGMAAVMFQVSAPPFMMRHSDPSTRDHLFSANWGINIGIAGVASLVGGRLPALFGGLIGVDAEAALAYRATFGVVAVGLLLSIVPLLLLRKREPREDREPRRPRDTETERHGDREAEGEGPELRVGGRGAEGSAFRMPGVRISDLKHKVRSLLPVALQRLLEQPWRLIRLLISPLLISFGAALTIRYLDLFFKETFAIPDSTLGAIFAGFGIATGAATLGAPIISQRIGKIRTVALAQILSIPFLLTLGFVPVFGVVVGAALIRQALFNMGSPLYDAFAMEQIEEDARPIVIGLINGAYTAGYLFAPLISTRVQMLYGFTPLFVATALFYTLAAGANYVLFIRGRADKRQAPDASRRTSDR